LRLEINSPGPPSQQVSIVWQREHCSLPRISINTPPHTGQAGRGGRVSLESGGGGTVFMVVP
jgi:hypothetical protein